MATRSVYHRTWSDLHPDDGEARLELREWTRQTSQAQGHTERGLSEAAGYQRGWARAIWSASSWRLATMQWLCSSLGYDMEFNAAWQYGEGMAAEPPELRLMLDMHEPGTSRWHAAQRMWLADYGRRLREAKGIPVPELALRLSMTPTHLREWEAGDKDDYLLLTAQRYFRALGNPLRLILRDREGLRVYLGPRNPPPAAAATSAGAVGIEEVGALVRVYRRDDPDKVVLFTRDEWQQWLNSDL